jgi:hypothetical protein
MAENTNANHAVFAVHRAHHVTWSMQIKVVCISISSPSKSHFGALLRPCLIIEWAAESRSDFDTKKPSQQVVLMLSIQQLLFASLFRGLTMAKSSRTQVKDLWMEKLVHRHFLILQPPRRQQQLSLNPERKIIHENQSLPFNTNIFYIKLYEFWTDLCLLKLLKIQYLVSLINDFFIGHDEQNI